MLRQRGKTLVDVRDASASLGDAGTLLDWPAHDVARSRVPRLRRAPVARRDDRDAGRSRSSRRTRRDAWRARRSLRGSHCATHAALRRRRSPPSQRTPSSSDDDGAEGTDAGTDVADAARRRPTTSGLQARTCASRTWESSVGASASRAFRSVAGRVTRGRSRRANVVRQATGMTCARRATLRKPTSKNWSARTTSARRCDEAMRRRRRRRRDGDGRDALRVLPGVTLTRLC